MNNNFSIKFIITDLIKFTKESTSPEPTVVTLSSVHDIKTWISPFLNPFTGHSTPHCFKIIKDAEGEVKIYYKCWSSDPWCKEDEVILPLNVSIFQTKPQSLSVT